MFVSDNKNEKISDIQKDYMQKIKESLAVKNENENQEIEFLLKRL